MISELTARSVFRAMTLYALAGAWLGCGPSGRDAAETSQGSAPDETRFTKEVLVDGLDEAFQIEFDDRGRVYWIERSSGNLKRLDETTGEVTLLGKLPSTVVAEGGLLGILLARDFATSRQIYFYYSFVGDGGAVRESRISRFTVGSDDRLDPGSEVVLLRWPIDTDGHMGGGMTWDADGNLYLSVGDNSAATQYSPFRFTAPGGAGQDALRTAGNTNDLRGKILRIHPEPDGTYTIPDGNLFPPGTPNTRPEIYTMGDRNPWRLSIDSRTGYLHWGEIGPDAGRDSVGIGPMGYDEFNVARGPGNFGWPMFIGYNRAYNRLDYATGEYAEPFDPAHPVNPSPNNTGLRELPPAQPPLIAYPYGVSEEYPFLSSGGRAAVGGPIFHRSDFGPDAPRVFPDYYEGKWFVVDYVRNWIFVVTMNPASDSVARMERFAPKLTFLNPIDMQFGPNGDLYVVEYGRAPLGKISKIVYNGGNRPPHVTITADRTSGATPLRISLSADSTVDYDGDELTYEWAVTPEAGGAVQRFATASPTLTLSQAGAYEVVLTARDPEGATGVDSLRVLAGNEAPVVTLEVVRGNSSFYFPNSSIEYRATVTDREDGDIDPADVYVSTEFVPSGLTPAQMSEVRALAPDASARHLQAFALIESNDCRACHSEETRLVGPAFREVAEHYSGQAGAADQLASKIIAGGSGVWGETAMPPHPSLTHAEATTLAEYVLSVGQADEAPTRVAMQGALAVPSSNTPPGGANPARVIQSGSYLIRATYTDEGAPGAAPLTSSHAVLLRQPRIAPQDADVISEGTTYAPSAGDPSFVVNRSGAYIGFHDIDLTGIDSVAVGVLTRFYSWSHFIGGTVEVRLDSPTGELLGAPIAVTPPTAAQAQTPRPSPPPQEPPRVSNPSAEVFLGTRLEEPVSFPVGDASGRHDVYVVFRNDAAGEDAALFLVTAVQFKAAAPSAAE